MPGKISIPYPVKQAIREHVEAAVKHAESGYTSAQEEEDTVTGELGGALRTSEERTVNVIDWQPSGTWRWGITYSKFGSKAANATESIIGADGILELRVGGTEEDQRKSALFQAKNAKVRDPKLVEQCAKMSVWREACFVINYTANGYTAYSIDDVLQSQGSIARASNGIPLASWIIDTFIGCRVGHPDLHYDKNERKLYWKRIETSEEDHPWKRWVCIDFMPKHLIQIDVTPPNRLNSLAVEVDYTKVSLNRLAVTPRELFGLEGEFTMSQLKKRRAELLVSYHPDKNNHLREDMKSILSARFIEINEAFSMLSGEVVQKKNSPQPKTKKKAKASSGLEEPKTPAIDELFVDRNAAEPVKIRHTGKHE